MPRQKHILYRRLTFAAIAAAEWFALGLQFYLTLKMQPASPAGVFRAAMLFGSFFTIFASTLVAIVATRLAIRAGRESGTDLKFAAAVAVCITIVCVVWITVIRGTYALSGLWLVADGMMHVILPPLYVLAWTTLLPKRTLVFFDAAKWLILPLVYAVWMFARGAVDGWYPYPFLNVDRLGYGKSAIVAAVLLIIFWIVGLVFVAADGFIGRVEKKSKATRL